MDKNRADRPLAATSTAESDPGKPQDAGKANRLRLLKDLVQHGLYRVDHERLAESLITSLSRG